MYPVMLNVDGKKCVIAGGGRTALRKAKKLSDCGAKVTVVSPDFCDSFDFAEKIQSEYKPEYIKNSFLVIAATNNSKVNKQIAEDAQKAGILVSLADSPKLSDFVSPCSQVTGDITLTASTNGKYPILAKKLCKKYIDDMIFYNELLPLLEEYRKQILLKHGDTKNELLEYLISDEMISLAKKDIKLFKAKADKVICISAH